VNPFDELIDRGMEYVLSALAEVESNAEDRLRLLGSTPPVKALQAVRLQRAVLAVGMFSIFDAHLQSTLKAEGGFRAASALLRGRGLIALDRRFTAMQAAINALKHGEGWSYGQLLESADSVPFRVKRASETFFDEGDVGEVRGLIQADEAFVREVAGLIVEVSDAVRAERNLAAASPPAA